MIKSILVLIVAIVFISCNTSKKTTESKSVILFDEKYYINNGYVKAVINDEREIDGCGFLIEVNADTRYQPLTLPEQFKKDNLVIYLRFQPVKKPPMSTCMRGVVVNVIDIVSPDIK